MQRRRFLTSAMVACSFPGLARAATGPVIGFLNGAAYELSAHLVKAFHAGLAEIGFVEGKNVTFEYRTAEGHYDRLPALAADLVGRGVDLIAATGTPTGLPAKAATSTIPIVFVTGSDPIQQGLVANIARPGGNITGATTLAVQVSQKRVELLHEMLPKATRLAALINEKGPNVAPVTADITEGARLLGLTLEIVHASAVEDLEPALAKVRQSGAEMMVIGVDTFYNSRSARLAEIALRQKIPSAYQYREFAAAGGLMSYGGSIKDAYRVAGEYAGRILKGEKPGDLPVQQSTKAELFINAATAAKLGIVLPPTLLVRTDELIE